MKWKNFDFYRTKNKQTFSKDEVENVGENTSKLAKILNEFNLKIKSFGSDKALKWLIFFTAAGNDKYEDSINFVQWFLKSHSLWATLYTCVNYSWLKLDTREKFNLYKECYISTLGKKNL